MIGGVGACAGTTYVTGFTVLQESVSDELRGRTFATLYTVVRLCLLISLTISPLWADFWDWVTEALLDRPVGVASGRTPTRFPECASRSGAAGLITFVAGFVAWRSIRKAEREAVETGEPMVPEHGPIEFVRSAWSSRRRWRSRSTTGLRRRRLDDGTSDDAGTTDAVGTTEAATDAPPTEGDTADDAPEAGAHRDARPVRRARGRRRQRQEHAGGAAARAWLRDRGLDVVATFEPGAGASAR